MAKKQTIYTYHAPVPGINPEHELKLLLLWKRNWEAAGYDPVVLNEHKVQDHALYGPFSVAIDALPNINPAGYERACFMRWLAMAHVGGGLMADHDVFIYDKEFQFGKAPPKIVSFQRHTPCLVYGSQGAFDKVVNEIMAYQVTEKDIEEGTQKPHVSDMYMLYRGGVKFTSKEDVKNFGVERWETAPFVHYSNSACKVYRKTPRHEHIEKMRGWQ